MPSRALPQSQSKTRAPGKPLQDCFRPFKPSNSSKLGLVLGAFPVVLVLSRLQISQTARSQSPTARSPTSSPQAASSRTRVKLLSATDSSTSCRQTPDL
ncbi:hypothetical protein K438DRAFT_1794993, partial [Mycena galopus ATCC 62051]